MRRITRPVLMSVSVLVAVSISAQPKVPAAPMTPSDPHEKLTFFAGTWTSDALRPESNLRERCDWLGSGRRHMVCHSTWETPSGRREGLSIFSYRPAEGAYIYQGFRASGATQTLTGRVTPDGGWEFAGEEGTGDKRVRTRVRISPRRPEGTFRFVEQTAKGDSDWSAEEVVIYRAADR